MSVQTYAIQYLAAALRCALRGVSDATVDFAKSTATVTYDPKKTKEDTLLAEALKGTKYTASKIGDRDKDKKDN